MTAKASVAQIRFSTFTDAKDKRPNYRGIWPWANFVDQISQHAERSRKDGPAFSAAGYRGKATRGNDGVVDLWAYVADLDQQPDWEALKARLAGLAWAAYSTHSFTPENGKCRVILPFDRPVLRADWPDIWQRVNHALFDGGNDPQTKDPARIHYLPSCPPGALRFFESADGAMLDAYALPPAPEAERQNGYQNEPLDLTAILAGVPEGERDSTIFRFACKLRGDGVAQEYAELMVRQAARACRPAFGERVAVDKVRRAYQHYEPNTNGRDEMPPGGGGLAAPGSNPEPAWPEPLDERALYGWLGDAALAIELYSEADRAALLGHLLSGVGALLGPHVRAVAGDAMHPARINSVCVGETSKGRKGSAARPVERLLRLADDSFRGRMNEGLSSGEGLIWQVRDPIYRWVKPKGGGEPEEVLVDPGVDDKRLWVIESEFASTLRVLQREGNTLSALVRRAWDTGDLATLTKNSPARATGAHIAITGHVTKDELLRYLDRSELASGFANRFLWLAVRRGRPLPDGEGVPDEVLAPLADRLRTVLYWAAKERTLRRDEGASAIWHTIYEQLSEGKPGMLGAATNRAEAQVLRLSALYAILDCSEAITPDHLLAAVAVWRYAEQSAGWIFGDAVGDGVADTILTSLRQRGELSRNDVRDLLGGSASSTRIDQAFTVLVRHGLVTRRQEPTGGRPREVWCAS